jgi:hypothetical protein
MVVKTRRMIGAEYVACIEEIRKYTEFFSENLKKGRDNSEDLGVYGGIILNEALK